MDSQHSATSETSAFGRSSGGPLDGIVIADFSRVLADLLHHAAGGHGCHSD